MVQREYQVCSNCVMDTSDSLIRFDENDVCDHCRNYYDSILPNWQYGSSCTVELDKLLNEIREYGKGKRYDCMIGLSGGLDSSFLAYAAVRLWGLRPKFINVDTHWDLPVADENISKLKAGLGIEIETIVVDWEEQKDLHIAFLKSQVPYQDIPQDLAIFAASYCYAVKNNIKIILNGGNHSTECIREPVEWGHINDISMLRDIHRQFGAKPLVNYPLLGFFRKNLYYRYIKGLRIVKALDLIPYKKQDAIELLGKEFGWEQYQHKHYENRFTRFYEGYWCFHKFGYDRRRPHYSSLIVTEQVSREAVIEMLEAPPYEEEAALEDLQYIASRLDMTEEEFVALMKQPNRTWRNYKSSKALIDFSIYVAKMVGMERRNYR